jgi:hypothetical protein
MEHEHWISVFKLGCMNLEKRFSTLKETLPRNHGKVSISRWLNAVNYDLCYRVVNGGNQLPWIYSYILSFVE